MTQMYVCFCRPHRKLPLFTLIENNCKSINYLSFNLKKEIMPFV